MVVAARHPHSVTCPRVEELHFNYYHRNYLFDSPYECPHIRARGFNKNLMLRSLDTSMTKSNSLFVFALLVLAFPLAAVSRAQDGSAADKSSLDSKVKELQERLDRVETQNRQLVQLLQELKARLDAPPQPVNANVRTAESLPALPAASASTVGS